jgi:hypothetical protein
MSITMKIEGANEVLELFRSFPERMQRRALPPILHQAMEPVRAEAKSRSEIETGALEQSLETFDRLYRKSGVVLAIMGPSRDVTAMGPNIFGYSVLRRPANYAHCVERGHRKVLPWQWRPHGTPGQAVRVRRQMRNARRFGDARGLAAATAEFKSMESGNVAPRPFEAPAFDHNADLALSIVKEGVRRFVESKVYLVEP